MNIAEKFLIRMFVPFFAMLSLQMTCLAGQSNLVANANVETGSPASWSTNVAQGTIVAQTWATDRYVSTSHSLKSVMSNNGQADWRQSISNIDATVNYRLRAHIYASNITTGSHSVEIQWFNGGTYLSTSTIASTAANSWVEAKLLNITPPANATVAYLLLRTYKTGTYYFDDIVFMREDKDLIKINEEFPIGLYSMPDIQLLINTDMERLGTYSEVMGNGMGPWGWTAQVDYGTAALLWDTTSYSSGARSVNIRVTAAGQADWRQKTIDVKPGASYILGAKIYASNVSAGAHEVTVQWFSASNTYLGSNTVSSSSVNVWSSVTSGSITAPAGASYAWILCRAYSVGTYNFDMVTLTRDINSAGELGDAYGAGFNYLRSINDPTLLSTMSSIGLKGAYDFRPADLMYQPDGTDPAALINNLTAVSSSSALSIWMAPDESANEGMSSAGVVNGCNIVKNNDSYYNSAPHYIWMNHAPKGIPSAPTDFTTLKPFCTAADIVSMDVYPVPYGSDLANQTISCVGEYVDILYNNVVSDGGTQRKPIWMVLQGGYGCFGFSNSIELQWFDANNNYISENTYLASSAGSWQQIADSNVRPPAGATHVYVLARTYLPGTYYFDDISFSTGGTNLLSNSNMETGSPANWTTWSDGKGSPSQTWSTTTYHSSNHSLKTVMTGYGSADWRQHITGINPANTYSLSAWLNVSNVKPALPTWTQTRFMTYNAIIHGARGIAYFHPAMVTIDSGAWSDLKNIATEINSLSDALTSNKSFRTVTASNANIETLLMEYNGNLYLLAANTSSSSTGNVTFTISGLPLSSSTEFFESRQLTVSSNHFTESAFSGYQVHVYSIH